ncbi:MAG: BlaI/MecI/CopY family transcriptional regulator [Armatimonadetes bacterium]|nr:BlaI/MecI/CopY family transcriptional regulator [Armatimonadota bacterium]
MDDDRKQPHLPVFRPRNEGLEKMLGKLEAQLMEILWNADRALNVEETREALAKAGKASAYTTIMTTLSRMYNKGLLAREMIGKAYYYTPRVSQRELTSGVTKQVIDGLLGAFAEPAMAYFVEALSDDYPDKLDTLEAMIRRRKQEQSNKKSAREQ